MGLDSLPLCKWEERREGRSCGGGFSKGAFGVVEGLVALHGEEDSEESVPEGSEDAGVVVSACLEHLLLSLEAGIGGDGGGREVVESVLSVAVHGPPLVDPLGLPGLFGDRRGAEVGASLLEAAFDEEIARLPEQPGGDHRPRPFTESSRVSESASSTSSPASPRAAGNSSSSSAIPRSIAFTCSFTRRNWATSNRMISTALRAGGGLGVILRGTEAVGGTDFAALARSGAGPHRENWPEVGVQAVPALLLRQQCAISLHCRAAVPAPTGRTGQRSAFKPSPRFFSGPRHREDEPGGFSVP